MASNISIALNVHSPKKDAVFAVGAPTVGAQDVAIWAGANVPVALTQSIVGEFIGLHTYAQTILKDAPASVTTEFGNGSDPSFEVDKATPGADDVTVFIGSEVAAKAQSHFLDRTFKRLIERWLEATKTGDTTVPVVAVARIFTLEPEGTAMQPATVAALGNWEDEEGNVRVSYENEAGEMDSVLFQHTGVTDRPFEVLVVLGRMIDQHPLFHAEMVGGQLAVSPEADEYTLDVEAWRT